MIDEIEFSFDHLERLLLAALVLGAVVADDVIGDEGLADVIQQQARAIGVGTGSFSIEELTRAGAAAAFSDLTDLERVSAAILGDRP